MYNVRFAVWRMTPSRLKPVPLEHTLILWDRL
jgi:hypothetical protein